MNNVARIAITPGDPAGIGPDILLQLFADKRAHASLFAQNQFIAFACPQLLAERAQQLKLDIPLHIVQDLSRADALQTQALNVFPIDLPVAIQAGQANHQAARYILNSLDQAILHCQQKHCDALVTGPINKHVINEAGVPFTGHTEYLAEKTHTPRVVMMLANSQLRVALATTHLPLREVADSISSDLLEEVISILHTALRQQFGIDQPNILICGLNPHAGENGDLGEEELTIMAPCIEKMRQQGMNLSPPLPADTLFTPHKLAHADAVLAMYHDQGLPVLKAQGFGESVNITLGLPIIRTSVDHGTAFELAGTGQADIGSFVSAINMACELARKASNT